MKRSRRLVFTLTFAVLASACSTGAGRYAGTLPGSRFHEMKRFYVQKASEDDRGLHEIIRDEMVRIGIDADAGEGEPAGEYDAVVTYIDRWSWDVTTFCMQLTIYVRDTRTGFITATGWSYRPSIARKTPAGHARLIVAEWFGEAP
jgi:hypothetical protein